MNFNVPHLMIFLKQRLSDDQVIFYGKKIQKYVNANINFITCGPQKFYAKTYERGAGLTFACGTGVCACFVASNFLGKLQEFSVYQYETRGGVI